MNTQLEEHDDTHVVDLAAVFGRVWAMRLWVIASVVVCFGGFAAAAFLKTPVYRATAVLASASADRNGMGGGLGSALGQLGGLAAMAGVNIGGSGADTEEALAVLRSREFTERFINSRNLLPELYPDKWDGATRDWKVAAPQRPTPAKGYQVFDKKIRSVIQDKKTGLISLQIDWTNRAEAADWANDLVQRLNSEMRVRAMKKSDASVEYLEKELATTSVVATREAINRLIEAEIKQRMFANVNQEYAFRIVDKALAADADDPVSPKRMMMMIEGLLLGVAVGVGGALLSRGTSKTNTPTR